MIVKKVEAALWWSRQGLDIHFKKEGMFSII